MSFPAGKVTTIECVFQPQVLGEAPRLKNATNISLSLKSAPFPDVLATIAKGCNLNFVLPDNIQAKIIAQIANAPCDQAIESILEAQGLWYVLDSSANILRISPRRQIDAERADAAVRPPSQHKQLPASTHTVDLDFKDAPIQDLVALMTTSVGKMNFVFPDDIQAKTTVVMKGVPWERAFEAVLEAHGLWYRYREEGKIIRIAPRRQLDAEEEAERAQTP